MISPRYSCNRASFYYLYSRGYLRDSLFVFAARWTIKRYTFSFLFAAWYTFPEACQVFIIALLTYHDPRIPPHTPHSTSPDEFILILSLFASCYRKVWSRCRYISCSYPLRSRGMRHLLYRNFFCIDSGCGATRVVSHNTSTYAANNVLRVIPSHVVWTLLCMRADLSYHTFDRRIFCIFSN